MRISLKGVGLAAATATLMTGATMTVGAQSPAAPDITIGFSVPAVDDYYGVVRDSFVAAAEAQGVKYLEGNGDGAGDPTQQIAKIDTMLAQGIDVLAVAPPGDAFVPVLDRAKELGVKVIFIDQQVPDWEGESTFIATDNPKGSQLLGDYLAPKLKAGDQVGIMIGIPGIPLLFDRYNNFKNTLEAAGITVTLSSEADGCQLDTAVNVVRNFVVANPGLDAIYATCGPTGVAATQVLQEQGNPALSLTWDVPVQQINDILEGKATAAVAQFPQRLGENAVAYALKVAAGEEVPAYVDNGTEIVTIDNAGEFFHEGTTGYSYKLASPAP
jgi:ABC-type sugar transport system substrate-binding protein